MNLKRDGGRIAGVMDLPILAGIEEAEYVWILICFKELRTFSCRQGRGVLNTPYRRPGFGANDFVRYAPNAQHKANDPARDASNGPFGPARGAYAIRPYSLPAGDAFSYGQGGRIGIRFQNEYPQKEEIPLPRPGKDSRRSQPPFAR